MVCRVYLLQDYVCKDFASLILRDSTGGGHLAATIGAGGILCGKQHEVRVRFDHLAQLRHIQLPVIVQQPAYSTDAVSL